MRGYAAATAAWAACFAQRVLLTALAAAYFVKAAAVDDCWLAKQGWWRRRRLLFNHGVFVVVRWRINM